MRRPYLAAAVLLGLAVLVVLALSGGAYLVFKQFHGSEPNRQSNELAQKLQGMDPEARVLAIERIGKGDPKTAVPTLVRLLAIQDEDVRLRAAMALGEIGAPAVPALQDALTDSDKTVRFYAVWALGMTGPAAKATAPAIIKLLGDKDEEVRYKAAFALSRVAPDSKEAVAALIAALKDPSESVREEVVEALARVGPLAVPPLRQALTRREDARLAADALVKMAQSTNDDAVTAASAAVPDILGAFDGSRADDVNTLAGVLPAFGGKALPALRPMLKDKDPLVRAHVAAALHIIAQHAEQMGDAAVHAACDLLAEQVADVDPRVRAAACRGFQGVGTRTDASTAALEKALLDETYLVSSLAYQSIGMHHQDPEGFQLGLLRRVNDAKGEESLRLACVMPHRCRKMLVENLPNAGKALQLRIACALVSYQPDSVGERARVLLPIFAEAVKSKDAATRRDATWGLGRLRASFAGEVTPLLEAALNDEDRDVRQLAASGLGKTVGDERK